MMTKFTTSKERVKQLILTNWPAHAFGTYRISTNARADVSSRARGL